MSINPIDAAEFQETCVKIHAGRKCEGSLAFYPAANIDFTDPKEAIPFQLGRRIVRRFACFLPWFDIQKSIADPTP